MPGAAGLDQEGDVALIAYPNPFVGRFVRQAGLTQDRVRERDVTTRTVEYVGVRLDQAFGRRGDLRQPEDVAELLRRLVRALFGLSLKTFAEEPGGSVLRVIAVLVVAPLLRHRARPVFMCKVRGPHPADLHAARSRIFLTVTRPMKFRHPIRPAAGR
jgi:hypothetical protein